MICDHRDVALAKQPSSHPSIGFFDGAFMLGQGRITKPGLRADLSLEVWPGDKLGSTIKSNGFARQKREGARGIHDLAHNRFCALIWVLQKYREPAHTFDKRGHI